MARGKSVTKLLLDSSQAALYAGIEIHNKPHVAYRYPTAVILITNAWELLLKAYIYKYVSKKRIYEKDGKHTISFFKALAISRDDINAKVQGNQYKAVFENIDLLNEYRCANIHFAEGNLDPIIFMLISKAVLNYDVFMKTFFKKDITKDDNLIILPVGFKLPFDPIDYLKQDYGHAHNDFVNAVVQTIRELDGEGVSDSVIVGFNLVTDRVKNLKNADIVAALENIDEAVPLRRAVRITDNPNAPEVRIKEQILPLKYADVRKKAKERNPNIKFGKVFNESMRVIKANSALCQPRYLDPDKKDGTKTDRYAEAAIDELLKVYAEKETSS